MWSVWLRVSEKYQVCCVHPSWAQHSRTSFNTASCTLALHADAQLLTQVAHPARALRGGFADIAIGHLAANAYVHICYLTWSE
jgi:hypothetical protein